MLRSDAVSPKAFYRGHLVFKKISEDLEAEVRRRTGRVFRDYEGVISKAFVLLVARADEQKEFAEELLFVVRFFEGIDDDKEHTTGLLYDKLESVVRPRRTHGVLLADALDIMFGPGSQLEFLSTASCVYEESKRRRS